MKNILLLGAGLSSSSLIKYLLNNSEELNIKLIVVDQSEENIISKTLNHKNSKAIVLNALDKEKRIPLIKNADIVISMLPAIYHIEVAKDCLQNRKHLITPSYISSEMLELNNSVIENDLIFLNEIGVDPGIDHMSACKIMNQVKKDGGKILEFKSYCGGLIAPESDDNPWHYKFTWNPRNVVIAGYNSTAKYLEKNEYKYLPYQRLFLQTEKINVPDYGDFDAYANRDSLSYLSIYSLNDCNTLVRGTLRKKGFCEAWNVFVQLGMTNPDLIINNSDQLSPRNFLNSFLPYDKEKSVEDKFLCFLGEENKKLFSLFEYLDIFNNNFKITNVKNASAAQLLETILIKKWNLKKEDKDMLVMVHQFVIEVNNSQKEIQSSMVSIGENQQYTAMSNTVGLPMAICVKLILQNKIKQRGVILPIYEEIYNPVLKELESFGIKFIEKIKDK